MDDKKTSSKHRPGPWNVHPTIDSVVMAGNAHIADLNARSVHTAANARLIAASPDLLEALKELEDNATQAAAFIPHILLTTAIEKARAAIAKAEGANNE